MRVLRRLAFCLVLVVGSRAQEIRFSPACLSVSPLRAIPATLDDSLSAALWRDRLVDSLQVRARPTLFIRPAGQCPEGLPVLDVFQIPGDLLNLDNEPTVRIRLEWRQSEGLVELLLRDIETPRLGEWADAILALAYSHMSTLRVTSPQSLQVRRLPQGVILGPTPIQWFIPPGEIRLEASGKGLLPRTFDSIAYPGQILDLHLQLAKNPKWDLPTWPAWSATAVSLLMTIWYSTLQAKRQNAYQNLGPTDADAAFQAQWNSLHRANLARNTWMGLFFGSVAAGITCEIL